MKDETFLPEERAGVWTCIGTAQKTPPAFTIDKLLPHGIVFLAAPPKSMKTTVTLAMGLSVAGVKHGVLPDELQQVSEPGRVMFLNAEHAPGEMLRDERDRAAGLTGQ